MEGKECWRDRGGCSPPCWALPEHWGRAQSGLRWLCDRVCYSEL